MTIEFFRPKNFQKILNILLFRHLSVTVQHLVTKIPRFFGPHCQKSLDVKIDRNIFENKIKFGFGKMILIRERKLHKISVNGYVGYR